MNNNSFIPPLLPTPTYDFSGMSNWGSRGIGLNLSGSNPLGANIGTGANVARGGLGGLWDQFKSLPLTGGRDASGMRSMGKLDYAMMGLTAGLQALQGFQANRLAKRQLKDAREQFRSNFNAQAGLVNSQLADRQNRRIASADNMAAFTGVRPNHQDTASYLAQYGVRKV